MKDVHSLSGIHSFAKRVIVWFSESAVLPSIFATFLRLILFMLGIALVCGACSPRHAAYRKAKKNLAKIEQVIRSYPELADSLNLTQNEPITSPGIYDSLQATPAVDSSMVDSLAIELAKQKHDLEATIKSIQSRQPQVITQIREKLIRAACPDINTSNTFFLTLIDGSDSLRVPLDVHLQAVGGQLKAHLSLEAIHWDRKREKTRIDLIEPEKRFFMDVWFWVSVGLAVLLILVVIKR